LDGSGHVADRVHPVELRRRSVPLGAWRRLGAFLKVGAVDLRSQFVRPARLEAVLGWAGVGVPLATIAVLGVLPLPGGIEAGMLLCMPAPPVGSAASMAAMLGLNPALALTCTVVHSLLSPLLLPPAAAALGAVELHIDAALLTLRLGLVVMGAAALSAALRRCANDFVRHSAHAMTGDSVLGLLVVAIGAMRGMQPQVLLHGRDVVSAPAAAFALNLGFQAVGAMLFARLGVTDTLTVGLVSGNRNVTLVWAAAAPWLAHAPDVELFLAASVFPIFMLPLPMSRLLAWRDTRLARKCATDSVAATVHP